MPKTKSQIKAENYTEALLKKYSLKELQEYFYKFLKVEGGISLDSETRQAIIHVVTHPEVYKIISKTLGLKSKPKTYKTTGSVIKGGKDLTLDDPEYQYIIKSALKGHKKYQIIDGAAEEVIIKVNGKYKKVVQYFGVSKSTFEDTYARNIDNIRKTAKFVSPKDMKI